MIGTTKKIADAIYAELRRRGDGDLNYELLQLSEQDWEAVADAARAAVEQAIRPAH